MGKWYIDCSEEIACRASNYKIDAPEFLDRFFDCCLETLQVPYVRGDSKTSRSLPLFLNLLRHRLQSTTPQGGREYIRLPSSEDCRIGSEGDESFHLDGTN